MATHRLHTSKTSLPPHPGFFPTAHISTAEEEHLIALASKNHAAFLARHNDNLHTFWNLDTLVDDVEVCHTLSLNRTMQFRSRRTIAATLEEVYDVVSNLTDDQMSDTIQHTANDFLDTKILHEIHVSELKHVAVRWFAMKNPAPISKRDFCVLETQEETINAQGRRVWALSQHSVAFHSCPDLNSSLGLVRGDIVSAGLICAETEIPGTLELHYYVDMDLRGRVPQWTYKLRMRQHAASFVSSIHTRVHEMRLRNASRRTTFLSCPRTLAATAAVAPRRSIPSCGANAVAGVALEHSKQAQRVCMPCSNSINLLTQSRRSVNDKPLKSARSATATMGRGRGWDNFLFNDAD
ncbi:hypothetical protein Ae201684_000679 [Aphanomyces euteiches]|uniref:START domain-containing protein n=1 Tax=Aphanomyces euteiches TaxID=100861 RepID=A0A6G0XWM4_9STRA|nr:hypothetical protein Ae201684_000679 [Aphanomyces euteiches]